MTGKTKPSRRGRRQLAGHFSQEVLRAVRKLAVQRNVTHQTLLAEALNDLFEKYQMQRLADETALPRGRMAGDCDRPGGPRGEP